MSPTVPVVEQRTSSSVRETAAVLTLALGIFTLVTIEELPIGVLTLLSADLGVSPGIAGLAVTIPGVLAGIIALATPMMIRSLDRRLALIIALGSVVISCVLSVLAPTIELLLLSRIFAGIAIGMYWAVVPIVAMGQVAPRRRSRALAIAMSGTGAALVLGVPFSAWLGSLVGWRASFAVVGGMAALVLLAQLALVAPVRSRDRVRLPDMTRALRQRGVRYAVGLTGLVITGQFITYSYVSPLLQERAGVAEGSVGYLLFAFGIAGLVGNFAVTPVLRRHPVYAVIGIGLGIAGSLLVILLAVHSTLGAVILMPVWGLFVGSAAVSIQSFVSRTAADVEEQGTAINSAMFNIAIAAGAAIGGMIIDGPGLAATVVVTIVLTVAGAGIGVAYLVRHAAKDGRALTDPR